MQILSISNIEIYTFRFWIIFIVIDFHLFRPIRFGPTYYHICMGHTELPVVLNSCIDPIRSAFEYRTDSFSGSTASYSAWSLTCSPVHLVGWLSKDAIHRLLYSQTFFKIQTFKFRHLNPYLNSKTVKFNLCI